MEETVRSSALIRLNRRGARHIAVVTGFALASSLVQAMPARAAEPKYGPVDRDRIVEGRVLKPKPRKRDTSVTHPAPAAKVSWPKAGTAHATVPTATGSPRKNGRSAVALATRAGSLPIWVTAPGQLPGTRSAKPSAPVAGRVEVRVLDRRAAQRAKIDGLLFTIGTTAGDQAGKVGIRLDYSGFGQAFGGSYGSRLRLVRFPGCVLTTPDEPECQTARPVTAANNTETKTLAAEIDAAAIAVTPAVSRGPKTPSSVTPSAGQPTQPYRGATPSSSDDEQATVLAAVAGASSDKGDYTATSLSPSSSWQISPQSGDFNWSYPLRTPPVPGGLQPQLALGYSSSSIDGRTSNTSSQPSWVGDGFDLWPGYIQRSYKSCKDDGVAKNPTHGTYPGDQCWGYDNAVMTLGGKGGELVPVGGNKWKRKNDDGTGTTGPLT
ncbi:hypothetical protein ACFYYL_38010, partial [Actinomadura geliboluensis]